MIPLQQLSRFENELRQGRFTDVWKGSWQRDARNKTTVAIKQLKDIHKVSGESFSLYDFFREPPLSYSRIVL